MHQKSQTGCKRSSMVGKSARFTFGVQNLPRHPEQQHHNHQAADSAKRARLRERLGVIVVAMIYDQAVIKRFVARKKFLQRSKSGTGNGMGLEDLQTVMQHFD